MVTPKFIWDAMQGLKQQDVDNIIAFLKDGGLCILPSDSSYILTGFVTVPGVSKDIDFLLARNGLPMSLAFGDLEKVTEKIDLNNQAYKFIKSITPGGLTFVAPPLKKILNNLSSKYLFADGTIGVRLSESSVESQIANYFPLPSVPIRNDDDKEVSEVEEAWRIISSRSANLHSSRNISLIEGHVKYPGRLSTVVKEELQNGYRYIKIIRAGAISSEKIEQIALECKYRGVFYNYL